MITQITIRRRTRIVVSPRKKEGQNLMRVEGAARKIQRQLDHQRSASAALCGNADAALSVFSGPEQMDLNNKTPCNVINACCLSLIHI